MPERKTYLVTKAVEPDQLPAYAASLEQLPGDEVNLTPDIPAIVKLREMTEDEAAMVAAREHILFVEPEGTDSHPAPVFKAAGADNMSPEDVKRHTGADKAHAAGHRGKGQRTAVIDSGVGGAWAKKYAHKILHLRSYVEGEGWESPDDTHGEFCASAVLLISPDAEIGVFKSLSGKTGSGPNSGTIRAVNDAVALGYTGITMSLSGGKSEASNAAVRSAESKGVHVTVAAGNEQRNSTAMTSEERSPASEPSVTTVAAGRSDGTTAPFSSWGRNVDVKAPGENTATNDVAGFWDGTSMACPFAQGMLNLLRGAGAAKDEAKRLLYATARDSGEPAYVEGFEDADVSAALGKLLGSAPVPDPKPQPGAYLPDLPRFTRTEVRKMKVAEIPELVLTGKDTDSSPLVEIGHLVPKARG